jgi:hypothetical protein
MPFSPNNLSDFLHHRFTDHSPVIDMVMQDKKFLTDYRMADDNTFVGIEVEVERVLRTTSVLKLPNGSHLWGAKEDGSLRNEGREFVSLPIKGKAIPFALTTLHGILHNEKNCVGHEFSERTSVHVHVDARELSVEQLANVVLTYIMVEPLLYKFCGKSRHQSIFCVPLNFSDQGERIGRLMNVNNNSVDTHNNEVVNSISRWLKYTGFNLRPLVEYGTMEFRHMPGTMDVDLLINWINILLKIKNYGKQQSFEKYKARLMDMNTTSEYFNFLMEVFGEHAGLLNDNHLQSYMEEMVIFIKDIFTTTGKNTVFTPKVLESFNKDPFSSKFAKHCISLGLYEKFDIEKLKSKPKKSKAVAAGGLDLEQLEQVRAAARDIDVRADFGFGVINNNDAVEDEAPRFRGQDRWWQAAGAPVGDPNVAEVQAVPQGLRPVAGDEAPIQPRVTMPSSVAFIIEANRRMPAAPAERVRSIRTGLMIPNRRFSEWVNNRNALAEDLKSRARAHVNLQVPFEMAQL